MTREIENLRVIKAVMEGEPKAELLKGYTGWGGLKQAMYTPGVYRELKEQLSAEEIDLIKKTMGNAYYTPASIVKVMFKYLQGWGFTGGHVLEPAAGAGVFIEYMPEALRKKSKIYAVELEPVSAKILAGLYPDVTVKHCGFETLDTAIHFDLIIGNPPYGKERLVDAKHPDLKALAIHHYFATKSMRLLKEGGILAMVLPSFFMDNVKDHARGIIAAEGGALIDAFRLPDHLFDAAKVTVDLVFLQKGGKGSDWLDTDRICVKGESFKINQYFSTHPHHILGELSWVGAYGRKQLSCIATEEDHFKKLDEIILAMNAPVSIKGSVPDFDSAVQQIEVKMRELEKAKGKIIALQGEYVALMKEISQVVI